MKLLIFILSFSMTAYAVTRTFTETVKIDSLTASRAIHTDASKNLTSSSVTSTELGYLSGVTSAIQTQLDAKVDDSEKGANNGVATLDAGGKIPAAQLPNTVMEFQGTWNASTNTPTLIDGTGNTGDVYLAAVAGSQDLGSGSQTFAIGDWVIYNGTIWEKSINSNAVVSVNGQQGVVSLDSSDIAEDTSLYFTDERAQDAIGLMIDSTFTYTDVTPLLTRAALTGDVTASAGSNATTIANNAVTFAKMQAITDGVLLGASGGTAVEEITVSTGLVLGATSISSLTDGSWTSANTDIDGLLPGSTSGYTMKGVTNGHLTMLLRDNDNNDSFSILPGSGNYTTDDTYDKVVLYAGADGVIGIGTTNPSSRLQIGDSTVSTQNQLLFGKYETASQSNLPLIQHKSILSAGASSDLALGATSTSGGILFYTGNASPATTLGSSSNALRMSINSSGTVTVVGDVTAASFTYSSDERLKKNITKSPGLDTLKLLKGVQFEWKDSGRKDYGVIAQDIEKVLPELVNVNEMTGMKGVKYASLIAILIESVKELDKRVKTLEQDKCSGY